MMKTAATLAFQLTLIFTLFLPACSKDTEQTQLLPVHTLRVMNADQPVIGIDGNDHVFAAWSKANAAGPNADGYASRYSSLLGWDKATFIGDSDNGMVTHLHTAVSTGGSVFAAWYKVGTGHDNIYVNRYVPGTGWGSPEALTGAITILDLQITADADGNAIVIWEEPGLPYYRLYARRYVPGTGWNAVLTIDDNTGTCSLPRIAADAAGNVIAVWQHDDGGSASIYANRYSVTSGWGTARQISNGTGNAFNPDVAVNTSGAAIAVWYQNDSGTYNAYASRFSPVAGWEAAQLIESGSSDAYFVRVAIDNAGAAIAVWRQPDIYFNRYVHGAGWGTEQMIAQGIVGNPGIFMNAQGKAVATWNQWDPASAYPGDALVYAKRFDPAAGWGTTVSLMSELGSANAPQAVVDSSGNITVIWSQSATTGSGDATTAVFTQKY